jgi:hypothetical protein
MYDGNHGKRGGFVMNPFDYVNSINYQKTNLILDDESEKGYNPFLTNHQLSYFPDTVQVANAMNRYYELDKKLQYDFLLNIVRKRKRFSKWGKPEDIENLEVVKEYYGYSNEKAKSILPLLSQEQVEIIKSRMYKGGRN